MSPRITAIEPQKKNPHRVNIYLDGEFAFGLRRLVAAWLQVGQELSDDKIAALRAADEREEAYQKALHFLRFRPRSVQEVRQNLQKHGLSSALIEETLQRLQEAGWLDDRAFARAWVENRVTFRPRAPAVLQMELRRKGIAEEIIDEVLHEMTDAGSLALEAARRQARRLHGLAQGEFYRKLGSFLARRGFSYALIPSVCAQVWDELHADGETVKDEETIP
jgi:regulatory protein